MTNWLLFSMTLKPSTHLLMGKLHIMDGETPIESYVATSGLVRYQDKKHQSWRGIGAIPECNKVGISSYSVLTEPYSCGPDPKNTEILFHVNKPFRILVDGIWRAGFGIHFDAENPGSGGCIALRDKAEWNEFIAFMANYAAKGFSSIPLIVEYDALPSASATIGNRVAV
jgi:hypothetical protein